jgi:MFS transporter, MHS family, proline/betaine transporter
MTKVNIIKSTLSASVGNVIEWYEYTLYAYFATVISSLFFPVDNPYVSMMMTFATFAIGLAARPIGGIVFGYIGDNYSRKKMLTITMLLMSISTMCIGLLPTYNEIGVSAPILLIILRILQGIALGGEFGGSCVYLFESVPQEKRGFFGSMALTGVGLGLVLSSCTIFIVESLVTKEEIYSFAWRIPFFISILGSIMAFYMRKTLLETEDFLIIKKTHKLVNNPFLEMLRNHKSSLFSLFAIFLTTQVSFFIVFIFGKTMMVNYLNYDNHTAGKFNLFTVISYTVATLFFGYLSDKINKRYIIIFGTAGILLTAYPFILSLKIGASFFILVMSILLGILIGMTEGTLNPLVAESFPTNIRVTSVAFCWNFTSVAFGGIAPIISMWLIENSGGIDTVAYYLMTVCTITIIITLYTLRKLRIQKTLDPK